MHNIKSEISTTYYLYTKIIKRTTPGNRYHWHGTTGNLSYYCTQKAVKVKQQMKKPQVVLMLRLNKE